MATSYERARELILDRSVPLQSESVALIDLLPCVTRITELVHN